MKTTEGNICLLNKLSQLILYIFFWFLYPVFKKCIENTGIGTLVSASTKNKSIGVGQFWKKWYRCIPICYIKIMYTQFRIYFRIINVIKILYVCSTYIVLNMPIY